MGRRKQRRKGDAVMAPVRPPEAPSWRERFYMADVFAMYIVLGCVVLAALRWNLEEGLKEGYSQRFLIIVAAGSWMLLKGLPAAGVLFMHGAPRNVVHGLLLAVAATIALDAASLLCQHSFGYVWDKFLTLRGFQEFGLMAVINATWVSMVFVALSGFSARSRVEDEEMKRTRADRRAAMAQGRERGIAE